MQNNSFKFESTPHDDDQFGNSSGIGPMNSELLEHIGSVGAAQPEDVPLHLEPDHASATIESSPVFTQLLAKPPIASIGMGESISHVIPGDTHTEDVQEGPVGLTVQGVSLNNSSFERTTEPTPENPDGRPAAPMTSMTRAAGIHASVPLQNVDPEMAKSILGQLVQVLQQAGQLPEDAAFQHLVQMSAGQRGNVSVRVAASMNKKAKHASSTRLQQSFKSPVDQGRKSKYQTAIENAQEMKFSEVQKKRAHSSRVTRVEDVRRLNVSENSVSSVEVKSEIDDCSLEELVSDENHDKYNLSPCEVKLTKLSVKRDARGRVVVPKLLSGRGIDVRKYLSVKYLKSRSKKKSREQAASVLKSVFVGEKSSAFPDSIKVNLLPNMNEAHDHAVRTMYMGPTEDVMQWLTVVWWRNSHFFCQCVFCPLLAESPKTIVRHLREDHPELSFALNKKDLLGRSFLFINCRHCDFVTVDPVILWIHLELHHGISGILDGGLHPDIDFSVRLELNEISGSEVITSLSSYVCFDCFRVSTSSKALALHVLQEHADTLNYNGCFVKLMMIQKPSDRANVTYNQAISDAELANCRWDVFICMLCDLCVKCPYTVLSHTLSSHQNRHVLFTCAECSYNTISDGRMILHLTDIHGMPSRLVCSATVVGKTDGRFVEIPIEHSRKTCLNASPLSSAKASLADVEATINKSAVNGTPKRKRKTAKSRTRTVKRNGIPAARSAKRKKAIVVRDGNDSILNSTETHGSQKSGAALNEGDTVDEDANHTSFAAVDSDATDTKVKEEIVSPDFDNESSYVVEDADYRITLADEVNSDSDNQIMTTNARHVRGDTRKPQATNDVSTRELLHEPIAMDDEVIQPFS